MHTSALCVFVAEVKDPEPTELLDTPLADDASRQHRYASGQYFFEYLVVVSLKNKVGSGYEPQITYQFPKVSLTLYLHAVHMNSYVLHTCVIHHHLLVFHD